MAFYNDILNPDSVIFAGREDELSQLREVLSGDPVGRVVAITGPAGIGKTALAHHFASQHAREVTWISFNKDLEHPEAYFLGSKPADDSIIVADGLDTSAEEAQKFLDALGKYRGSSPAIITSRSIGIRGHNIDLGPLPTGAVEEIWKSNFVKMDFSARETAQLIGQTGGHPTLATLLGRLIRDEIVTVDSAMRYLKPFESSGLVGPDGRPLEAERRAQVETDLQFVDTELVNRLTANPEMLYELSPRRFEELVAGLLERLGYETELTPATRDGGKDIYAARQDGFGRFLYIVECKRHAPDNPVGVGIVRQLAGVINAERANGGIVATTAFFTKPAQDFQKRFDYQLQLKDYFGIQDLLRGSSV